MNYLEVPDFHFSPKWSGFSREMGKAVAKAAEENRVDFIAVPGDWFNGPIYANDKGGLKVAKWIMKEWLNICPVVAIEGTPSHDAPGCYGIFEDMGLVLMKPGKSYGYYSGLSLANGTRSIIIDCGLNTHWGTPQTVLFGIPELSKKTIQSKLGLPAEQANAMAEDLLKDYIEQFIAPNRLKFKDVPAVCLFHGNLSDSHKSNEHDIILKASDIVIHTESFIPADLDRVTAGHIHTPWESMVINCGYAGFPGMDDNPWGKIGFVPAMNLITIEGKTTTVERVPYGSPERKKVYSVEAIQQSRPDTAWWAEVADRDSLLPQGLHPWSRLTVKEKAIETRRVSEEQAAEVKTLWDLFLLIDPDVPMEYKEKVDQITETVEPVQVEKKDVVVSSVEIAGCVLFKGKTVKFDLSKLEEGLNLIAGQNGDGKSSLLSFCHPYPVVIGKDTKSGRDSAIKDFFSGKESWIKKTVYKNGTRHDHMITIKAAHTKSPKTECYFTVDGEPQLDKGSFDEMFALCESEYGSLADYKITTFCEQPNQASANLSGLMSAKPIDARNIVQAIAGVDREREKRFALDKASDCQSEAEQYTVKAATMEEFLPNKEELTAMAEAKSQEIKALETEIATLHKEGTNLANEQEALTAETDRLASKKQLLSEVETKKAELKTMEDAVSSLASNKLKLKEDNKAIKEVEAIEKLEAENEKTRNEDRLSQSNYNTAMAEYNAYVERAATAEEQIHELNTKFDICADFDKKLPARQEDLKTAERKQSLESRAAEITAEEVRAKLLIDSIDGKCEHCGKLSSKAQATIDQTNGRLETLRLESEGIAKELEGLISKEDAFTIMMEIDTMKKEIAAAPRIHEKLKVLRETINNPVEDPPVPETPKYHEIGEKPDTMLYEARNQLIGDIAKAETASLSMSSVNQLIAMKQREADAIEAREESIDLLTIAKEKLITMRERFTDKKLECNTITGQLGSIRERLDNREAMVSEINELRDKAKVTGVEAWQYIAGMLSANKIPALELDLFLGTIDSEATDCIEPFLEGRYSIETLTQEMGKKGMVDRFDIIVHDREEGSELSLFSFNPGHKAFFSDAYIKALILQRNQRLHRSYSPVIFDEADSPIKESRIGMYYDINQRYYQKHASRVLVVSQKDSASAYMAGEININDLKE